MLETFSIPGVGGIIEKIINNNYYVLIQVRDKEEVPSESGLFEIPAGKIRDFENIFDCLKREIKEETGLTVVEIVGQDESFIIETDDYKVLNYTPFTCAQNLKGKYPIMVQVFICKVTGRTVVKSNESRDIRWISLVELKNKLIKESYNFYPMHIKTLEKYIKFREKNL